MAAAASLFQSRPSQTRPLSITMRRSLSLTPRSSRRARSPRAQQQRRSRERELAVEGNIVDAMGGTPCRGNDFSLSFSPRLRFFPPLPLFFGMAAVIWSFLALALGLPGSRANEKKKRERERKEERAREFFFLSVCVRHLRFFLFFSFNPDDTHLSLFLSLAPRFSLALPTEIPLSSSRIESNRICEMKINFLVLYSLSFLYLSFFSLLTHAQLY
jgi:hypothetical protein